MKNKIYITILAFIFLISISCVSAFSFSNYTFKTPINCTANDGSIILVNGSNGFTLNSTSKQFVYTNCYLNSNIYWNNDSDYVIGNDTNQFNYIVASGTVFSNNASGLLGSNAKLFMPMKDQSTTDYNMYGVSSVAGKIGGAYSFNGASSNYISSSPCVNGNFTISLWLNPTDSNEYQEVMGNLTNTNGQFLMIYDTRGASNTMHFYLITSGGSYGITSGIPLTIGSWNMVTFVYDQSNTKYLIYINNVNIVNVTTTGTFSGCTNSYLGTWNFDAGQYYTGYMDDYRIYNSSLTKAQISSLYNSGLGTPREDVARSNMVAHISMDAGYDWSGTINPIIANGVVYNSSSNTLLTNSNSKAYIYSSSNTIEPDSSSGVTIHSNININSLPTANYGYVFGNGGGLTPFNTVIINYQNYPSGTYTLKCSRSKNGVSDSFVVSYVIILSLNTKYDVACSYNATVVRLYLNGVEVSNGSVSDLNNGINGDSAFQGTMIGRENYVGDDSSQRYSNSNWENIQYKNIQNNYTQINHYYNNYLNTAGYGNLLTTQSNGGSVSLSSISPLNNSHTNVNFTTFFGNVTSISGGSFNVTLFVNGSARGYVTVSSVGVFNVTSNVSLSDGSYSWFFGSSSGVNTSSLSFVVDTVNPVMSWITPSSNTVSKVNLSLNVTGSDANLWAWGYNVTNISNSNVCSASGNNLSSTTYNMIGSCNFTTSGLYIIQSCFADSHTIEVFRNATTITKDTGGQKITYLFDNDMISVEGISLDKDMVVDSLETSKLTDRYSFSFNTTLNKPKSSYPLIVNVTTNMPIYKVYNSKYKGHYVIGTKYWIDFESENTTLVSETKINNTLIMVFNISATQIKFNSLGGLNEYCENRTYFYDVINPSYSSLTNSGSKKFGESALWNVTLSDNYGIGGFIFSTNNSGSWVNDSFVSGNFSNVSVSKSVVQTGGRQVCGLFYFNDSANNFNSTSLSCFIVGDSVFRISQVPSDITTSNLVNSSSLSLNITYGFSIANFNVSSPFLNFTLFSPFRSCWEFHNGTCDEAINVTQTLSYSSFSSINYSYILTENEVYPDSFPINDNYFRNTTYQQNIFSGVNNYAYFEEYAVVNNTNINLLEVSMTVSAGSYNIYLSNSSGKFSTLPVNSFTLIGTLGTVNTPLFHCHSGVTKCDQVFSFNLVNGRVNNVTAVTSTMYVYIIPTSPSSSGVLNYVPIPCRSTQYLITSNNGNSFASQNVTPSHHIHQYDTSNADVFTYNSCGYNSSNGLVCSVISSDNLDVTIPQPSPGIVTFPNGNYLRNSSLVNISYTSASTSNSSRVVNYNISLYNSTQSFDRVIVSNNSLNLSYLWNISGVLDGQYYIRVDALDNQSIPLSSFWYSGLFTIDNTLPVVNISSSLYSVDGFISANVSVSELYLNYSSIFVYYSNGSLLSASNLSNISVLVSVNGVYFVNASAVDLAGNIGFSSRYNFTVNIPLVNSGGFLGGGGSSSVVPFSTCPSSFVWNGSLCVKNISSSDIVLVVSPFFVVDKNVSSVLDFNVSSFVNGSLSDVGLATVSFGSSNLFLDRRSVGVYGSSLSFAGVSPGQSVDLVVRLDNVSRIVKVSVVDSGTPLGKVQKSLSSITGNVSADLGLSPSGVLVVALIVVVVLISILYMVFSKGGKK